MGYCKLTVDARSTLQEVARMAYGSGLFEGKKGGSGRMGVLLDGDGKARVVKFNTHSYERTFGQSVSENKEMLTSSDNLRLMLRDIADGAGLAGKDKAEIYRKLGLTEDGRLVEREKPTSKDLLTRKIVASVVSMIGGNRVWQDAWRGIDRKTYSSGWKTQLKDIQAAGPHHPNAKSVARIQTFTAKDIREILPDVKAGVDSLPDSSFRKIVSDRLGAIFDEKFMDELAGLASLRGVSRQWAVKYLVDCLAEGIKVLKDVPGLDLNDPESLKGAAVADVLRNAVRGTQKNGGAGSAEHPLLMRSSFKVRIEDLHSIGITTNDLGDAFDVLRGKFGLSDQQMLTVSKMTMAYLASKLGDAASRATLPDASKLLDQIKEGKFLGTFVGLLNCGALDPNECDAPEGTILHPKQDKPRFFFAKRDEQTCENLTFLLGKCNTVKESDEPLKRKVVVNGRDEEVDYYYGGLDIHLLDALAEKQSELVGMFNDTGKLSMGDICRSVLGQEPALKPGEDLFQELVVRNVLGRAVRAFGLQPRQQSFHRYFLVAFMSLEGGLSELGCSFENLAKLRDSSKAFVKLEINQTHIDSHSANFSSSKESCINQIAKDVKRAPGDFYVKFGDTTIHVGKQDRGDASQETAKKIFDAAFEYIHGKDPNVSNGDPMSHQLRQALHLCHQAAFSTGYSIMGSADSLGDREFYFDQGGALHCVLKQKMRADNNENAPLWNCSSHFVTYKDGTNKLLDFTAIRLTAMLGEVKDRVVVPKPGEQALDPAVKSCLDGAFDEAFSEDFIKVLHDGHYLDSVNVGELMTLLEGSLRSLIQSNGVTPVEAQKDPEAVKRYLVLQLQVRCLGLLDPLKDGTYGLNQADITRLQSSKLMPEDLLSAMKSCALRSSKTLGVDSKFKPLPDLSPTALYKALCAASVSAAAQLRNVEPGMMPYEVKSLLEKIEVGSFSPFVVSALAAESKTVDFGRFMRVLIGGNANEMPGVGLLGTGAGSQLLQLYGDLRQGLYKGLTDREAWRAFVETVSRDDFKFLSWAVKPDKSNQLKFDEREFRWKCSDLHMVFLGLSDAECAVLRTSGFDWLGFFCGIDRPDPADGRLLVAMVKGGRDVKGKIDAFWRDVTPEKVLGGAGANLSAEQKKLFRFVASCFADAVSADKAQAFKRIAATYGLILEKVKTLSQEMEISSGQLLQKILRSAIEKAQRPLADAIRAGEDAVKELFAKAQANADGFKKIRADYKEFAASLVNKGLIPKALKEAAFFGVDTLDKPFLDDLFNSSASDKYNQLLEDRKAFLGHYDSLHAAAMNPQMGSGTVRERRARQIAVSVVRNFLADSNVRMLKNKAAHEAFYKKVHEVCLMPGGLIDQIDACTEMLKGSGTTEKKALAVKGLFWSIALIFAAECWVEGDIKHVVHGSPKPGPSGKVEIGAEEIAEGMSGTLLALWRANKDIANEIENLAKKDPDTFFRVMADFKGDGTVASMNVTENTSKVLEDLIRALQDRIVPRG